MNDVERMEEDAIGWVIRQRDPAFDDWDAFTAWLEADPAHAAAYDEAAIADEDAGLLAPPVPVSKPPVSKPEVAPPAPRHDRIDRAAPRRGFTRRWMLGSAVAASIVAVFGLSTLQSGSMVIETGPGEQRSVTLAGGTRIDLNGDSRIRLDDDNPRFAALDRGEALFTVVHDESDPFTVKAGDATLLDVGTVFNVVRVGDGVRVAVSEGAVIYNPERQKVRIDAGEALDAARGTPRLYDIAPGDVAGWRQGRLTYSNAPLSEVAADLGRNLGQNVRVEGNGARRFSGVIILDRRDPRFIETLAPVLGVQVREADGRWTIISA